MFNPLNVTHFNFVKLVVFVAWLNTVATVFKV